MEPISMAIMGGLGLAGNILGQIKSSQAQKQYEKDIENRRKAEESDFNNSYYGDYLKTAEARSALNTMRKNMQQATDVLTNKAVQGGATHGAVLAGADRINDQQQNAMNNLLQVGERRKMHDKAMYKQSMNNLDNLKSQNLKSKVDMWGNFATNMGKLSENGILAFSDFKGFGKGKGTETSKTEV